MHRILVFSIFILFVWVAACTSEHKGDRTVSASTDSSATENDSMSSCTNPYSDNMKPMAVGMRAMYEQMTAIRAHIEKGDELQTGQFKMVDFIYAEPTDSSVLTDQFFMRAGQFKRRFNELVQPGANVMERFNLVVDACIQCHTENCPGPLKKIKKLKFDHITS
ncbi:MAG: hypothetical protein IT247_08500 [Bacteroidia bacterium]|nr:hypothetical protein [Bacteroidia bacterium]